MKIQYWKNGIMLGLVDEQTATEIKTNSKNAGYKVYDNGHYFSVE